MSEEVPRRRVAVVFDSSVVHSTHPDEFASSDIKRFVRSLPEGLDVRLFVPDVVRHERRYRMLSELSQMAASSGPLVRSLNVQVDFGRGAIETAVDNAIERAYRDLRLETFRPDLSRATWDDIVSAAVYRRPPFEVKGEKGFRDQLVIETARQVAERLADSELVLVSRDKTLAEGARHQFARLPHARVFDDLDAAADFATAVAAGIPFDEHNRERLASMLAFFGRPDSRFRSSDEVLAFLKEQHPQAFEWSRPFEERIAPMARVAAPVFLGAATGKRGWRTPITVIHELASTETALPEMTESLRAPGAVPTDIEYTPAKSPVQEGDVTTERRKVADVFDIEWLGNALGRTAPGKASFRTIDRVVHVKRTIQVSTWAATGVEG